MARPSLSRIRDLLRAENALIVHFSGLSNSSPNYYPADLQYARDNPHETRCCSSVRHDLSTTGDHLWGQVGLIVDPIEEDSVQLVRKEDGGTLDGELGKKYGDPRDTNYTEDVLLNAIHRAEGYDEWLVGPYMVRGVFVTSQFPCIRVASSIDEIPGAEDIPASLKMDSLLDLPKPISITQISSDLGLPIYSFASDGGLVKLLGNGGWEPAQHSDIYS
jgi:hypothetical protein